jgi:hypothetical protein
VVLVRHSLIMVVISVSINNKVVSQMSAVVKLVLLIARTIIVQRIG